MNSNIYDSRVMLESLVSPSVPVAQFVNRWFNGPSVQRNSSSIKYRSLFGFPVPGCSPDISKGI